jgi:hypothetical protein
MKAAKIIIKWKLRTQQETLINFLIMMFILIFVSLIG